jgi:hypothetical protein
MRPPDPTSYPDPLAAALARAALATDNPRVRKWLLALVERGESAAGTAPAPARPPAPAPADAPK